MPIPANSIPTVNYYYHSVWAMKEGARFKGHRGESFVKVITVRHSAQTLLLHAALYEDCDCRLYVEETRPAGNATDHLACKMLWVNFAQSVFDDEAPRYTANDFLAYLRGLIDAENADVIFVSTSANAVSHARALIFLEHTLRYPIHYESESGLDGGGLVISGRPGAGVVALDEDSPGSLERGLDFIYTLP